MKKTRRRRRTAKIERSEQMKGVNVLKDSSYDLGLHGGDAEVLEGPLGDDVQDEIALLRIYIRRMAVLAKGIDDLDEAIVTLGALGRACAQVASLLRNQKAFDASKSRDALEQALTKVMREFNLS